MDRRVDLFDGIVWSGWPSTPRRLGERRANGRFQVAHSGRGDDATMPLGGSGGVTVNAFHEGGVWHQNEVGRTAEGLTEYVVARFDHGHVRSGQ
jgi:hypothetical protein